MEDGRGHNGHNFEVVSAIGSPEPMKSNINSKDDHILLKCLKCNTPDFTDMNISESCSSDSFSRLSSPTIVEDCLTTDFVSTCYFGSFDEDLSRDVGRAVHDRTKFATIKDFISARVENSLEQGSFLVCNLSTIVNQYHQWKEEMPMVEPFYAVKCNPDPVILRLLAALGCNFDCATMGELELVINGLGDELSLGPRGKATQSIVYANPAKMHNMIKYAMDNDVRMTVFDGEDELRKLASLGGQKKFDLLLRLTTDDSASVCRFSKKFGCPVAEAPKLLELAKSLGLHVAGVSFHVGSGCGDAGAYTTALDHSRIVFEAAEALGMPPMYIVDIGGGFPGDFGGYGGEGMPTFKELAATIRFGITTFMRTLRRKEGSIRFIAEPGRYFVSACTTIITQVYARKGGQENYQALYVDDGVYGSFNNVIYDHATPIPYKLIPSFNHKHHQQQPIHSSLLDSNPPLPILPSTNSMVDVTTTLTTTTSNTIDHCMNNNHNSNNNNNNNNLLPSAVFGPTCDGLDQMCSAETTFLPRCDIGDWLVWENQGAYTHTASFVFNGYTHIPNKSYCFI